MPPPEVIDTIRKACDGAIDLDPVTEPDNPTGATTYYTIDDDGLVQDWGTGTVVLNPESPRRAVASQGAGIGL